MSTEKCSIEVNRDERVGASWELDFALCKR